MDDRRQEHDPRAEHRVEGDDEERFHVASLPAVARRGPSAPDDPMAAQFGPPLPAPTAQPHGGLNTYIGQPSNARQTAGAAHAAHDSARRDVAAVGEALAGVAGMLHEQAARLEPFVEGSYSSDLADPRNRVLADALGVARQADLQLARLGVALARLGGSMQVAQTNIAALQRERERLSTLYSIAQELNSALDSDDLLGRVLAELIGVVRAERGALMLWDEAAGGLRFVAARSEQGPLSEGDVNISRGIVERVWQTQEPLLSLDAQGDDRLHQQASVVQYGIRSVMCAPLRVRGKGVGIVYVDSRNQSALFDATALDLLAAFCNQAAIAIDNARLFADLRRHIREISAMKSYTDSILASIASGVVTADTLGLITTYNRAAERIFGVPGAGTVGRPYQEVLASLGDAELAAILTRAIAAGDVTLGHEVTRTLPSRGEVALRLNVSPLRDARGGEALGVAMVVDDLTELRHSQRQTEQIQQLFGRYVHPAVVRQLLADPSAVTLGGETREVSVLFADVRNYTRLAEQSAPAELMRLLNEYLHLLTEAVWQEEGTVTAFLGDALMAVFNAPLPQPDHAGRAVRAAWAMRAALERHALAAQGSGAVCLEFGIGVATGPAVVGNIGAAGRLQNYTAIGDAVNTAQRLQSAATANTILLSAATYLEAAPCALARELAPLSVKGKTQPLSVYQLEGLR
ncbi:MAG TPA: adenylate/guanylate cyclase domain-containing protein [Ktedonobacterales bacterium]|nr:adenylate/guanylate cyclase domain-containing protein [Ktedonobacterales bacterium]